MDTIETILNKLDRDLNRYLEIKSKDDFFKLQTLLKNYFLETKKLFPNELKLYLEKRNIIIFLKDAKKNVIKLLLKYDSFEINENTGKIILYKNNKKEYYDLISIDVILEPFCNKKNAHYFFLMGMFLIQDYYELIQLNYLAILNNKI